MILLSAAYNWYLHRRVAGFIIFAVSMLWLGHGISDAVANIGRHSVDAVTITRTHAGGPEMRTVTVRLPGKVIRRVDHVLIVQTPRYVFVYHGHRKVIQPKLVRIRFSVTGPLAPPVIAAVLNSGTPATVTVPVTVPFPVTVTVPGPTTTVTLPQATTTVTIPTTITLPTDSSTPSP